MKKKKTNRKQNPPKCKYKQKNVFDIIGNNNTAKIRID